MLASTHLGRSPALSALTLTLLLLTACEHGEGGICQNNSDCEDGLICDLSVEERGVCRSPGDIDAGSDAGMMPDAAGPLKPDASPDASSAGSGGGDSGAAGAPALDSGAGADGDGGDADGG